MEQINKLQNRNRLTYKGKKRVIARGEADRGLLK